MRGYAEEDLPVSQGLAHQRDLVVLQVAQAAVDQARRPLRRPAGDVPLVEKQDVEAAYGGVPGDTRPVYTGPDYYEVERVVPDVLRHSRGHVGLLIPRGASTRCGPPSPPRRTRRRPSRPR